MGRGRVDGEKGSYSGGREDGFCANPALGGGELQQRGGRGRGRGSALLGTKKQNGRENARGRSQEGKGAAVPDSGRQGFGASERGGLFVHARVGCSRGVESATHAI